MQLTKGANTALPTGPIEVRVRWSGLAAGVDDVDVSAFLLTADGRVAGDEGMVFYGQRASPDGAVKIETLSEGGTTVLAVDPARLADSLVRVAVTATLTAEGKRSFGDVGQLSLGVTGEAGEIASFALETAGAHEAAMILGEFYERNGSWKFRAVGQGFDGGLKPLAEHYGITVAEPEPTASPPSAPPASGSASDSSASAPPSAEPASSNVNLSKVSLSKSSPTISLEKKGGTLGEIKINLDWNQGEPKKGLFGLTKSGGIDLDLCCLYELADGSRLGVQALGNNFGEFERPPYIQLAGDDRTGSVSGGEWMRINGGHWSEIRRVLVYAMIYEGVPNWSATDGVVTLYAPGNPDVEVRMEGTSDERLCAVTLLENEGGNLKITRENRYFRSAQDMDGHYGFGLSWTKGRK